MPSKEDLLSGRRIRGVMPKDAKSILDLVESYDSSGAFNAGRLAEACRLYKKMIEDNTTIALTMAGAFTPTGLGGYVISAIKAGLIDFVVSTGSNLYHDIHLALDLPIHQGSSNVDDELLLKQGIVRIYDIFLPEKTLFETDRFVRDTVGEYSSRASRPISTAELHYIMGKRLLEIAPRAEESILATAAEYDVPVYTPSPGDSSIGMNTARLKLKGGGVIVDPDLDVLETAAIIFNSSKNGVIVLGGGSPKNFYFQTQPMLDQILGISRGGHDYVIQISVDVPQYGGLSGATLQEAVSWGKIKPREEVNKVTVYSDITIAAPLLFSYMLAKGYKMKPKNIYRKRGEMLEKMAEASLDV
ncbi:MAG: deoxyhypusine synthase family protein [Nitrososphaeria archaeon]